MPSHQEVDIGKDKIILLGVGRKLRSKKLVAKCMQPATKFHFYGQFSDCDSVKNGVSVFLVIPSEKSQSLIEEPKDIRK